MVGISAFAPFAVCWSTQSAAPPAYKLAMTVHLGAPDRWDYLHFDSASGRLYVSHCDRVTVLNGRTGAC
jgi:hypothetical protein